MFPQSTGADNRLTRISLQKIIGLKGENELGYSAISQLYLVKMVKAVLVVRSNEDCF